MGYYLVTLGGGVGAVSLHHAVYSVDSLEKEGEQGDVVLLGEQGVGFVELADVVGAVVRWEGDAGEDDFGSAGVQGRDDFVEVGAGVFDAQAAQAVVAAELDDDDGGLHGDDGGDAFYPVFGGVSADTGVDDAVVVAETVQVLLEELGVALASFGSVACGEAVSEGDYARSGIFCGIGVRGGRGRCD